jgi:hypothetical protein
MSRATLLQRTLRPGGPGEHHVMKRIAVVARGVI